MLSLGHCRSVLRISRAVQLPHHVIPGQERFRSLAAHFYRGSHAVILVYSLVDPASLAELESCLQEFKDRSGISAEKLATIPVVVVGNKSELGGAQVSDEDVRSMLGKLERILGIAANKEDNESIRGDDVGSDATLTPATVKSTPTPLPTAVTPTTPLATTSKISVLQLPPRNRRSLDASTPTDRHSIASTTNDVFHTPFSTLRHSHRPNEESTGDDFYSAAGSRGVSIVDKEPLYDAVHLMQIASPPHAPPSVLHSKLGKKMSYVNPNEKLFSDVEVVEHSSKSKGKEVVRNGAPESTQPISTDSPSAPPLPPTCHHFTDTTDYSQDGIRHFTASAKTGEGVKEVFDYLTRRILAIREREEIEQREKAALMEEGIILREEEEERKRKERKRGCC